MNFAYITYLFEHIWNVSLVMQRVIYFDHSLKMKSNQVNTITIERASWEISFYNAFQLFIFNVDY